MDSQKINRLLDQSCADALGIWAKGREIVPQEALSATEALRGDLNVYTKPDYDDRYIPPAYVINYQLSHVYMAWKALSCLERASAHSLVGRRDSIRIVDFGAGASAGRIGAALMAAEAFEDSRSIDSIYYDEIDASAPMQEMGKLIWQAFASRVRHRFASKALARAVEAMKYSQHMEWKKVTKRDCETWLTAFHVISKDHSGLKGEITRLAQHINPSFGVFSCNKGNLERMRGVFPLGSVYEWNSGNYPPHLGRIETTKYTTEKAIDLGFNQWYQNGPPFREVKNCAILFGSKDAQPELTAKIHNAHVIDDSKTPDNQVALGRKVIIRENGYDQEEAYRIVGSTETDPSNGRISNESPIGKALIGRTAGALVRVQAPAGEIEFEIIRVEC